MNSNYYKDLTQFLLNNKWLIQGGINEQEFTGPSGFRVR